MKFEYTTPEIEIKLFSTEAIMGESSPSTDIEGEPTTPASAMDVDESNTPPAFSYSHFKN